MMMMILKSVFEPYDEMDQQLTSTKTTYELGNYMNKGIYVLLELKTVIDTKVIARRQNLEIFENSSNGSMQGNVTLTHKDFNGCLWMFIRCK